jgi:hypothetical protein
LIACGRGAFARPRKRNDAWILKELTVHRKTLRAQRHNLPRKQQRQMTTHVVHSLLFEGVASLQHSRRFVVDFRFRSNNPNRK